MARRAGIKKIPNDSTSMIHLHDLAGLFLATYKIFECLGPLFWRLRQLALAGYLCGASDLKVVERYR